MSGPRDVVAVIGTARVATREDVDRANLFGVNKPAGPFMMAQKAGPAQLLVMLGALQSTYGDDLNGASLQLLRNAIGSLLSVLHRLTDSDTTHNRYIQITRG